MNKLQMSEEIIYSKKVKNLSWENIAKQVGLAPVFLTSACFGMNSLTPEYAQKLCEILELSDEVKQTLIEFPTKNWDKLVPTDPVIYRLYEIIGVYSETIKEIIGEKFGDGIMSAIDFSMHIDKEENPKGDRVVITMNGKFLPYASW